MLSIEQILQVVRDCQDIDEFLQRHPHPILVRESEAAPEDVSTFQTVAVSRSSLPPESSTKLRLDRTALPVCKKAGGKFANMISVGRTTSNDIPIDSGSVSKFHAYFFKEAPGRWFVQDANSSNGTFVNSRRIPAESPTSISDGMVVQFSPDTRYRFFTPRGLFQYLIESQGRATS